MKKRPNERAPVMGSATLSADADGRTEGRKRDLPTLRRTITPLAAGAPYRARIRTHGRSH